jgi:hypothetical protein
MITKKQIHDAPMWTVFYGPASGRKIPRRAWGFFSTGELMEWQAKQARRRGLVISDHEPQVDDELRDGPLKRLKLRDEDAWIAYLNSGGELMKVPDGPRPRHFRLYVVVGDV